MAERGTGIITADGITKTFRGPTTNPFEREANLERLSLERGRRAELKRLEDHHRQQYETEAQQFVNQSMTDEQFNARIVQLQTKYKQKFNQDKFDLESKIESRLGSIKQLEQFVSTGVMPPERASEAMLRAKLGPEAESAMFPKSEEKLATLQFINEMEKAGTYSAKKAQLERERLRLGHLPVKEEEPAAADERLGKLYAERNRLLTVLGGGPGEIPYRRVAPPKERFVVDPFRGFSIEVGRQVPTGQEPYYEAYDPKSTGKFWDYERVKPEDPRFPLIERAEQINREISGLYAPPGSLMGTATQSPRMNPPVEADLSARRGGSLSEQTKNLLQQRQTPQQRPVLEGDDPLGLR